MNETIIALRMERQFLTRKASKAEYIPLYRDMQPGQNVYWNGFGDPPSLSFRADFDDVEFNRERQAKRELIKGRFAGGNLGWIMPEDLELFASLYRNPLKNPAEKHMRILELIERQGPLTIQQMKEETGMLVKEITPVLHRLQKAFLIHEDQFDGEWDRGWYRFSEIFPEADCQKYTRHEALKTVLQRFAHRHVLFDESMAKSFYKLPGKGIKTAVRELVEEGVLRVHDDGYMLQSDWTHLQSHVAKPPSFVHALHRNDFLYKSNEPALKGKWKSLLEPLTYDHEPLQYLLIDGTFHGVTVGRFRNGPYDLNDVVCDLPNAQKRRDEIIEAIAAVNFGNIPQRFRGEAIDDRSVKKS